MQLRHAAGTDNGRTRDHNEDTFAIEAAPDRPEAGALFVVCDGMGGYLAGEVASELAAETIQSYYYSSAGSDHSATLRHSFEVANARVYEQGGGRMGTTGVAALFLEHVVLLANVGDSRGYLIRDGAIRQLTRDHSFVEDQVAAGVLTTEQARESSYRNIITRALGHRRAVEVDLFREVLHPGDRLLLCSDGLHGPVNPEEIAQIAGSGSLEQAVEELIELANARGGPDNITAVLIEVAGVKEDRRPAARPAATARLAQSSSEQRSAQTARAPVASSGNGPATQQPLSRPVQLRQSSSPPLAAARPRRAPIIGKILMTLVALAFFAGMFWLVLTSDFARVAAPASPTIPPLTPLRSPAEAPATRSAGTPTRAPTLVPTLVPTPAPTRAP